jgi:hypothetical protein
VGGHAFACKSTKKLPRVVCGHRNMPHPSSPSLSGARPPVCTLCMTPCRCTNTVQQTQHQHHPHSATGRPSAAVMFLQRSGTALMCKLWDVRTARTTPAAGERAGAWASRGQRKKRVQSAPRDRRVSSGPTPNCYLLSTSWFNPLVSAMCSHGRHIECFLQHGQMLP